MSAAQTLCGGAGLAAAAAVIAAGTRRLRFAGMRTVEARALAAAAVVTLLAVVVHPLAGEGEAAGVLRRVLGSLYLQPILSLYLGLVMGAVLAHMDAGVAIGNLFARAGRWFGGPPGIAACAALVPLAISLPCGHAVAFALLAALAYRGTGGPGVLGLGPVQAAVFAAAFLRTAYGTCAPAPAGGIARIGEAVLGSAEILRAPQLFALVVTSGACAWFASVLAPAPVRESAVPSPEATAGTSPLAGRGGVGAWVTLALFVATAAAAAYADVRRLDGLTWLALGAGLMAIAAALFGRVPPSRWLGSVPAQPLIGITAGFLLAASLDAAGSFELLGRALGAAGAAFLLGPEGVLVLLGMLPLFLPLACGRVAAAALVPLAGTLGARGAGLFEPLPLAAAVGLLTLSAAMSCAVAPAGGCLSFAPAPGGARAETRCALGLAAVATCAPLFAAYLKWMSAPRLAGPAASMRPELAFLTAAFTVGLMSLCVVRVIRPRLRTGGLTGSFSLLGAISGAVTTAVLFGPSAFGVARGLLAGAAGGALVSLAHRK